jgi:hypothetical protein
LVSRSARKPRIEQPAETQPPARDLDLAETLRRAAHALTPVVVDPGPELARITTFVDSIDLGGVGRGGGRVDGALVLYPVDADAVPQVAAGQVVIRSCDPREPWQVTARRLHPLGGRRARIDLATAAIAPLPPRLLGRTQSRGRESLVLAVPAATEDLDGCVFPVHGLSATHAIIETAVPFLPGRTLDPVELIGNRRILRQAAATVVETIPWIELDGSRRFRCRLLLEPSDAACERRSYDLLSSPARILRLLELGCMLTAPGWYQAPGWARGRMRLQSMDRERLIFALVEPPPDAIPNPGHLQIGCELFSVSYEMQVRLLRRREGTLEVTLPLVMRRRRRRREQRAFVPAAEPVWVTFRNPVTGSEEGRRVVDLSFGGLCFEIDPAVDVVWPGIVLENAVVTAQDERIEGGEIEVRSIERGRDGRVLCHAANRHADRVDDWALVGLLSALKHPHVEAHDGSDFRSALALYRRAGLLADFINRNLDPILPEAAGSWRRLHDPSAQIGCTFLYRTPDGLRGACSGVRAWERTWLAQHFASASPADGQVTGALHMAYLDFVLPRPDAHHMAFFCKSDNEGMNAFYSKFLSLTGTPEAMEKISVDFWIRRADETGSAAPPPPRPGYRARPLEDGDELCIGRGAERSLGRLSASALSFQDREIRLPYTDTRFQRACLRRYRDGHVVTRDGQVVTAALCEHTSPGVNLTWMLNAWWLIPVHPALDEGGAATAEALRLVIEAIPPVPNGDRFVITPSEVGPAPLLAAGFEKIAAVFLYVFDRSGMHRYYQYVADRYGEVDALVARRDVIRMARRTA